MTSGWSVVSVEPVGPSKACAPSAPARRRACGLGGDGQALEHLGARRAVDGELGAAEQRLAEHPALEEVEVLLAAHRVLDGEQRLARPASEAAPICISKKSASARYCSPWRAACAANSWK